ncbi:MAG: tetratricopeptide repeat protein [Lachnospiraceae bacterium]|nr:tetratricopeptide repeat protein [Lachnospiraceae bacterium]
MFCYNCGCRLSEHDYCTACGANVSVYKKIIYASNKCYNDGLEKASVRDLSGAINSLRQSIKLYKGNIEARNLLGLVYFETGEVVAALSEWVISKNMRPEKNVADDYINMIQNNATRLDTLNTTIKKYNQALQYCYQDSKDLAVIQLKKVLSLNPKFIRAHELLALLYIDIEEWERAERELKKCLDIDKNNTNALRYLKSVEAMLVPDESVKTTPKKKKDEAVRYESGNEVIIQPVNVKEPKNSGAGTLVNIFVGFIIGLAVMYFLVVPSAVSRAKEDAANEAAVISDNLAAETAKVQELQARLESIQSDYDLLEGDLQAVVGEDGTLANIDALLDVASDYIETKDQESTAASLEAIASAVNIDEASESFRGLYNALFNTIGPEIGQGFYNDGISAYQSEDYLSAIQFLTKAFYYDANNIEALYNLGNAYRKNGDNANAKATYEKVIELFPDTERAKRSQQYIDSLSEE